MRDYGPYGVVHKWPDVDSVLASRSFGEGVHSIGPDHAPLDILVSGDALNPALGSGVPVFLSGALSQRGGTTGPYFSGRRMGQRLGTGFISVSDPTLYLDDELTLSWYSGALNGGLQEALATVLKHFAQVSGRDLLVIGGSGGGYASLVTAATAGLSSFVWNPQTDVLAYEPGTVARYVGVVAPQVLGRPREEIRVALQRGGITTEVLSGRLPKRLLYLQNASDWHVQGHAVPFIERHALRHQGQGRYSSRPEVVMQLGDFGVGHAPPPQQLLERAVTLMLHPRRTVWDVVHDLQRDDAFPQVDEGTLPADLRGLLDHEQPQLQTDWSESAPRAWVTWPAGMRGNPRYQFHLYSRGERILASAMQDSPVFANDLILDADHVRCLVKDGFGHVLPQLFVSRP